MFYRITVDPRLFNQYSDALYYRGSIPCRGKSFFFYISASRPALGPSQCSIQSVLEALSQGLKRAESVADHSPLSSVEAKNGGDIASLPNTSA
jgi:hypothetical protein